MINLKIIAGIKYFTIILFTALIVFNLGCNKPTEPTTGNVTIAVEEASCTEVWLAVNTGNISLPGNFVLYENNRRKTELTFTQRDTVIVIENLLPKQNYSYKLMNSNNVSNEALAITLDTTSHNFTWQTFEFGQHSNSVLYDVAIIDENNIWAVGEIYMNDANGNPDPIAYNAIHWDGNEWKVKKISVPFRGNIITLPLEGVFAFSITDIWFVGSLPIHGDGNNWTMYDLRTTVNPNISLSKAWGTSSSNIYFVGRNGSIAHWNGSSWKKIESGITLNLQDIWGDINIKHNTKEIICIAANIFTNQGTKVIKIDENETKELTGTGLTAYSSGIWFKTGRKYYVVGGGVQTKTNVYNSAGWYRFPDGIVNDYYSYKVKGTVLNDIFIVGTAGKVIHYNGRTWKKYSELISEQVEYNGISSRNNKIVVVGDKGARACIAVGRK